MSVQAEVKTRRILGLWRGASEAHIHRDPPRASNEARGPKDKRISLIWNSVGDDRATAMLLNVLPSSPLGTSPTARFRRAGTRGARRAGRAAFTLIEVLLAIGIAAGILLVVLFFYRQSETLRARLLEETARISAVRLVMERLSGELSAARRCESFQQGLTGGADNLQFVKLDFPLSSAWTNQTNSASAPAAPFRLVSYFLLQDTNGGGLVRSEAALSRKPPPLPTSVVSMNVVSTNVVSTNVVSTNDEEAALAVGNPARPNGLATEQVRFLRFRYWDGTNWLEAWNTPDLPVGLEVSLGVEPLPPELTADEYPFELFRRVIYLPNHAVSAASPTDETASKESP